MKKIYLAGPDVFLPNALEHSEWMKRVCAEYGVEGMFPLDGQVEFKEDDSGPEKGLKIYQADVDLVTECDALVANLNPFRGVSADPGTCVEIGIALAQGKPVAVYTEDQSIYKDRAEKNGFGDDGWNLEDFGMVDNLMMLGPSKNVVHLTFEEAIVDLATQLKESKDGTRTD